MRKHRFRNSYFISAVSVSLVLCLIGLECVLLAPAICRSACYAHAREHHRNSGLDEGRR